MFCPAPLKSNLFNTVLIYFKRFSSFIFSEIESTFEKQRFSVIVISLIIS